MDISLPMIILIVILGLIEVSLLVYGVLDWSKQPEYMPNRMLWLILIFLVNFIGPIIYFTSAPRIEKIGPVEEDTWKIE